MPNPTVPQLNAAGFTGFIPQELWGKDHLSTLVYAETRAVDYGGVLDRRHMRAGTVDSTRYPTRLSDGTTRPGHDDDDCLRDAEHAGLLVFANNTVEFTDAGWEFIGKTRRAKAEAGFKGVSMKQLAEIVGGNGVEAPGGVH